MWVWKISRVTDSIVGLNAVRVSREVCRTNSSSLFVHDRTNRHFDSIKWKSCSFKLLIVCRLQISPRINRPTMNINQKSEQKPPVPTAPLIEFMDRIAGYDNVHFDSCKDWHHSVVYMIGVVYVFCRCTSAPSGLWRRRLGCRWL